MSVRHGLLLISGRSCLGDWGDKMKLVFKRFWQDSSGESMVEYALIGSLVAIMAAGLFGGILGADLGVANVGQDVGGAL
jgi:Flp pilus assembly pilin Flp